MYLGQEVSFTLLIDTLSLDSVPCPSFFDDFMWPIRHWSDMVAVDLRLGSITVRILLSCGWVTQQMSFTRLAPLYSRYWLTRFWSGSCLPPYLASPVYLGFPHQQTTTGQFWLYEQIQWGLGKKEIFLSHGEEGKSYTKHYDISAYWTFHQIRYIYTARTSTHSGEMGALRLFKYIVTMVPTDEKCSFVSFTVHYMIGLHNLIT